MCSHLLNDLSSPKYFKFAKFPINTKKSSQLKVLKVIRHIEQANINSNIILLLLLFQYLSRNVTSF